MNLTQYINKTDISGQIIDGLSRLVNDNKAAEILQTFDQWRVVINRRTTTRHGRCSYKNKEVELHVHLLGVGNEESRNQTLIHEISHVVVDLIWGYRNVRPHGKEWKHTMVAFGLQPNRCSSHESMNEFKMKKAKYIYACEKCEAKFPAMRKKKYEASRYKHNGCGGKLYLKQTLR